MKHFFLALAMLAATGLAAQAPFCQQMWTNTQGMGTGIVSTHDSCYVSAGTIDIFGISKGCIVKTNRSGDTLWTRVIGTGFIATINAIGKTPDKGFVIAGYTGTAGGNGAEFFAAKLDSAGNILWENSIGFTGAEEAYAVSGTSDNGCVLAGKTTSFGNGDEILFVKLSATGGLQWAREVGTLGNDKAYGIIQTSTGCFVACGTTTAMSSAGEGYLVKLAPNGSLLWGKTVGSGFYSNLTALTESSDGKYVVTGQSDISSNQQLILLKTDTMGQTQWANLLSGAQHAGQSVKEDVWGNLVVAGSDQAANNGLVARYDPMGSLLWLRSMGGLGLPMSLFGVATGLKGEIMVTGMQIASIDRFYLGMVDNVGTNCCSSPLLETDTLITSLSGTNAGATATVSPTIAPAGSVLPSGMITNILCITGIEDAALHPNGVRLYPNPSAGEITIELKGAEGAIARVYDLLGNECMHERIAGIKKTLSLEGLSAGAYLFTIDTQGARTTQKVLILSK